MHISSYFEKSKFLFEHAPAEGIRDYILNTPTGQTFMELVALKMMADHGKQGKNAETEKNSIYTH
jgi:hypothetical protein